MGLLALTGPLFAGSSVNDCLDELVTMVGGVAQLDGVYGYRTAKTELGASAVITSISDVVGDTPLGLPQGYDFIIDILVKIDGDYETAERTLNDACDNAWRAIWGPNEPIWSDCYPYAPTQKPASPQELVNWRRGILYVRVIPN